MCVLHSCRAGGWVVFEIRSTGNALKHVPISRAFETEEEAIEEMHEIYKLRELLN